MNEITTSRVPRWIWITTIWTSIALFEATQTVFGMLAEGMHHNWPALFATTFLSWIPWVLVTPLALRFGRDQQLKPITLFAHAGAAVSVNIVSSAWIAWMLVVVNPYATSPAPGPFAHVWFSNFYSALLGSLILYGAILAVGHVLESRSRLARQQMETARLNEQLSNAQLNALRRQIEPHFLFNSLNSISGLVRDQQNEAAVAMISHLSEFLRHVIQDSSRQLVPLAEEMEFSEKYLAIQKVRFAERLRLNVDVPDDLLSAQVPSLVLQPMVENAVKHGISKMAQGGAIHISASRSHDTLTLRVYNDGPAFTLDEQATSGVGMANIRTRLHGLYGDTFALSVQNRPPKGVEVAVSVPYTKS
jgi:signal transduction histidine kinase